MGIRTLGTYPDQGWIPVAVGFQWFCVTRAAPYPEIIRNNDENFPCSFSYLLS